jgi:hypothetical protein
MTCSRQLTGVHLFLHRSDACQQLLRMGRFALLLACQLCHFCYVAHLHSCEVTLRLDRMTISCQRIARSV